MIRQFSGRGSGRSWLRAGFRSVGALLAGLLLLFALRTQAAEASGGAGSSGGTGASAAANAAGGETAPFRALIISDLHFTVDPRASDVVVAGMAYARELTDAIVEETIRQAPDVFIMTGDNTNGGGPEDVAVLIEKLSRIRDAGIRLVITTGNHDFNNMTPEEYEAAYFDVIEADDRDENSLSYTVVIGGVVLLAMDDGAVDPGGPGSFSRPTMDWLRAMLKKYGDREIIFLSHHSVLLGKDDPNSANYHIRNPDLAGLLEGRGVRLALTGHFHAQIILEENGLYEIVSGMPFNAPYLMGNLCIEDGHISYRAEPLDLEACGLAQIAEALRETEERNAGLLRETFRSIVTASELPEERQEQVLDLIVRFLTYYTEGTLAGNLQEITGDPACGDMIEVLWEHNYGPWMKSVLEHPPLPATRLDLE